MSTGTEIVTDALKEIGVVSAVSPANNESLQDGLKKLKSMMERWLSEGIVIAFSPLNVIGNDLNEPLDCRSGIVSNLAIECAPLFNNGDQIVSPQLRSNARRDLATIKSLYRVNEVPAKVLSSTTPVGAGNSQGFYNQTFWAKGDTIEN